MVLLWASTLLLMHKDVTTAPTHSESYAGRLDFVKAFA